MLADEDVVVGEGGFDGVGGGGAAFGGFAEATVEGF